MHKAACDSKQVHPPVDDQRRTQECAQACTLCGNSKHDQDEKYPACYAAKFLKELIGRYSGNLALALGAYNAGPGSVDAADGVPHNAETMTYVSEILGKLGIQPAPPNNEKP